MINYEENSFSRNIVFDEVRTNKNPHNYKSVIIIFIFYKKIVLIGLVYYYFIENLRFFSIYVIHISKQDIINIQRFFITANFIGIFVWFVNHRLTISFNQLTNFDPEFIDFLGNSVNFSFINNKF